MRVIAAIDLLQGRCVRLFRGDYSQETFYSDDPLQQALRFQDAGFKALHIVDLDAAKDGQSANLPVIEKIVKGVQFPLIQLGGGIRSGSQIQVLLDLGVDRLIVGTVAVEEPDQFEEWIRRWGGEHFALGLDLEQGLPKIRGWLEGTSVSLEGLLKRAREWSPGALICTDIERDGTLEGPDYERYANFANLLWEGCELIAAGGVSHPSQVRRLAEVGVSRAVVGKALYETSIPLPEWASC